MANRHFCKQIFLSLILRMISFP